MTSELNAHNVIGLNIVTKHSGDTGWVLLTVTDRSGNDLEITLFANEGKPIILTLGEKE